jgi:hypothetical protein
MSSSMTQYIYHSEKARHYYGRYNLTENDIVYQVKYESNKAGELKLVEDTTSMGSHNIAISPPPAVAAPDNPTVSPPQGSDAAAAATPSNGNDAASPVSTSVRNQTIYYSIQIPTSRRVSVSDSHSHSHSLSQRGEGLINHFFPSSLSHSHVTDDRDRDRRVVNHRLFQTEEEKVLSFLHYMEQTMESFEAPFLTSAKDHVRDNSADRDVFNNKSKKNKKT